MRLRLISKKTIIEYIDEFPASAAFFHSWLIKVNDSDWTKPSDILHTFKDADILGRGSARVIFNIGGNRFRMVCKYVFESRAVRLYVCWIGTHAQYDNLCKDGRQWTINNF